MVCAFTNLGRGGGRVRGNQLPTFEPEFKFAEIQNSHVWCVVCVCVCVGGGGFVEPNFQLLMLSSIC